MQITGEISKAKTALTKHIQKTHRAAAMLNIGLAGGVAGREIHRISRRQEGRQIRRDLVCPTLAFRHPTDLLPRAAGFLLLLDGWREGDVTNVAGHETLPTMTNTRAARRT